MHHPEHNQRLFSNLLTYPEVKLSVCSYHTHAHPHPFLLGNPALPARGRRTGPGASPVRGQPWQSPAGPWDAWQREPNAAPETPPGLLVALQELWPQGMGRCWALSSAVSCAPSLPSPGAHKGSGTAQGDATRPWGFVFSPRGVHSPPCPCRAAAEHEQAGGRGGPSVGLCGPGFAGRKGKAAARGAAAVP